MYCTFEVLNIFHHFLFFALMKPIFNQSMGGSSCAILFLSFKNEEMRSLAKILQLKAAKITINNIHNVKASSLEAWLEMSVNSQNCFCQPT